MGTTSDKLNLLLQTKSNLKSALIEKGQEVTDDTPFSEYPDKVRNITTGGLEVEGRELVYGKDWIIANSLPYVGSGTNQKVNKIIYLDGTFFYTTGYNITVHTTKDFQTYEISYAGSNISTIPYVLETDNNSTIILPHSSTRICDVSTDKGKTWKTYNTAFSTAWTPMYSAYGNGRFVLGNNSTQITTSTNGITWSSLVNVGNISGTKEIIFVNGMFVRYKNTAYYTSSDGVTWTEHPKPFEDDYIDSMARIGNRLILCSYQEIAYSDDFENWTIINPFPGDYYDCFYTNISGDNIVVLFIDNKTTHYQSIYSLDGINWHPISIPFEDSWVGTITDNKIYAISTSNTYFAVASSFDGKIIKE